MSLSTNQSYDRAKIDTNLDGCGLAQHRVVDSRLADDVGVFQIPSRCHGTLHSEGHRTIKPVFALFRRVVDL